MKRRDFIMLSAANVLTGPALAARMLAGSVLAAPRAALAQGSERVRRIGVLTSIPLDDPPAAMRLTALKNRLKELGWAEGRNIQYEMRSSNGDSSLRPVLAKELVALKPDLLVTSSTPDTAALLGQTRTIPIVFSTAADPVGSGFVQSLVRPGGNATGLTNSHPAMGGKWLEILMEIAPKTARVGVLFNPKTAPREGEYYLGPLRELAPSFGVTLVPAPVGDAAEIAPRVASFAGDPAGGLVVIPDSFMVAHRAVIVAAAAQHRVPAIYPYYYFTSAGGLVAYGFSTDASSQDAFEVVVTTAEFIDLILRGANPAELPVRSPRMYELIVNLRTAEALGLTVPPALLARADKVLE